MPRPQTLRTDTDTLMTRQAETPADDHQVDGGRLSLHVIPSIDWLAFARAWRGGEGRP